MQALGLVGASPGMLGDPPSSLGKVPPSWQVTLRTPWGVEVSSGSHLPPGLGWDWELRRCMHCVSWITRGSYNCSVSSMHRCCKVSDSL